MGSSCLQSGQLFVWNVITITLINSRFIQGFTVMVTEILGGDNPDFEWQGWSKDFLGFEIFDFKILGGRKILASYFWGNQTNVSMFHVISFKVFWKFLCLGNLALDFLGDKFCSRDFFGFFGSSRDFLGFDFCPHLIIPGTVILPFFFLLFGRTLFISCTVYGWFHGQER